MEQKYGSKDFYKLLEEMAELHSRKSHDYANDNNPFGNYTFSGQLASIFKHSPDDIGFVTRFAEKLYRLANLESGGKIPLHESIDDTEKDICVIVTLWMAMRREKRNKQANQIIGIPGGVFHSEQGIGLAPIREQYCFTCGKTTKQGAALVVCTDQEIRCIVCSQKY